MAQLIADRRDMAFVLYEQLGADDLTRHEKYQDLNRKTIDMIITEARELGIKEILPTYMEGDRQGVTLEAGQVKVPACYHRAHKLYREGEWTDLQGDPEQGGQGLPHVFSQAVNEYLLGANYSLCVYCHMGHSVGSMIEAHGSEDQKELFVQKLKTGEWAGTMLLTEPEAGSDLGGITATATKNPDGTYSLSASKIFITVGEHDLAGNIIHPVLARVEGAPAGTKGISIFLVPKYWVNADGGLGERNDVYCSGLEEKMGLHGMSTCTMTLGAKGQCRGLLLGELNQGMKIMFHMMNEARLGVGTQAFMYASNAYLHALNYARERIQGKDLLAAADPDAGAVAIIQHPDVRRMLLDMKAYVEGMRSLVYYTGLCFDRLALAETDEEKISWKGVIDLITPVVKAYCADRGFEVCTQAMQVFGGYGYTKEYPVELLTRDCKITSIYEGTNGIQSMDLLGRKVVAHKGAFLKLLVKEIQALIDTAGAHEALVPMAAAVGASLQKVVAVTDRLVKTMMSPQIKTAFAFSYPYLEVMGDFVMAWMLLWRAATAAEKLDGKPKKKDVAYYEGQVKTAEHYIFTKLPVTNGKVDAILTANDAAVSIKDSGFGV